MEHGPGVPPTKYLEKPEARGIILNRPGSLQEKDLSGLGAEGMVDQGNEEGQRSPEKLIVILICFSHVRILMRYVLSSLLWETL